MPLPIMRQCRYAARVVLTALIAVGMTACAEEPPAERYTGDIEAAQEQERLSLKDTWDNVTTVQRAEPLPARMVDIPPPRTEPAPAVTVRPRIAAPAPPTAPAPVLPAMPKAKPSPPDLAISAPPAPRQSPAPPPAPSKALTEGELERDTTRCGVGVDCLAVLRAMLADPKQSWMMRAPTPMEFSNGTRLFAYRALRRKLDCGKLRFAGAEIDWALDTFSREVEGMAAEQRARVAALAGEVREELDAEVKQRC